MKLYEVVQLVRAAMLDISTENTLGKGCGSSFREYNDIILYGFASCLYMFVFEEQQQHFRKQFKYINLTEEERHEIHRLLSEQEDSDIEIEDDMDDDSLTYYLNGPMLRKAWLDCCGKDPRRRLIISTRLILRYCCDDYDVFEKPEY